MEALLGPNWKLPDTSDRRSDDNSISWWRLELLGRFGLNRVFHLTIVGVNRRQRIPDEKFCLRLGSGHNNAIARSSTADNIPHTVSGIRLLPFAPAVVR